MIYTGLNNSGEVEAIYGHLNGVKSEVSEVYGSIGYNDPIFYKRQTLTGTSPLTFKALGQPLKDYHIFGEVVQSGTPSTDGPVNVQGCGEMITIGGLSQPLHGIGDYKDTLDLSTGIITRRIRKYEITGDEGWTNKWRNVVFLRTYLFDRKPFIAAYQAYSTGWVYNPVQVSVSYTLNDGEFGLQRDDTAYSPMIRYDRFNVAADWINYAKEQYNNGTPITIWYVLQTPEYETVSVPPGLSGIIEGYLIQNGTPTPSNPIYPDSNGIKDPDGTYHVDTGFYKIPVTIGSTTTPIYIGNNPLYRAGDDADEVSYASGKIIRRIDPDTMQPYSTPVEENPPEAFPTLTTIAGDNTLTVGTTVQPSVVSITGNIKPTGYGQLLDENDVDIQDKNSTPIFIQG